MSEQSVDEPTISDRGFAHWDPTTCTYGSEVRVYESSAAMAPHLWLSIDGEALLRGPVKPFPGIEHGLAQGGVSAHLSLEQAKEVRDKLDAAIKRVEESWA